MILFHLLKQSSDNEILNNNHDFVNVKKKRKVMRISSDDEDDVSYNTNINGTSNDTSDFNKPATISFTKSQSTSMLDQLLNSSAPISFLDREPKADNAPTSMYIELFYLLIGFLYLICRCKCNV